MIQIGKTLPGTQIRIDVDQSPNFPIMSADITYTKSNYGNGLRINAKEYHETSLLRVGNHYDEQGLLFIHLVQILIMVFGGYIRPDVMKRSVELALIFILMLTVLVKLLVLVLRSLPL